MEHAFNRHTKCTGLHLVELLCCETGSLTQAVEKTFLYLAMHVASEHLGPHQEESFGKGKFFKCTF